MFKPEYIKFDSEYKLCFTVDITPEEYAACDNFSYNQWNNKKSGKYGSGIISKKNQKDYFTELQGGLGEMAFSKVFNTGFNTDYTQYGMPTDFVIKNKSLDVKTCSGIIYEIYPAKVCVIYAQTESGKIIPLKSDIYVCGLLRKHDEKKKTAQIILAGWENKSTIEKFSMKPSRSKTHSHLNYELIFSKLRPIADLYMLFNDKLFKEYNG